MLHELPAPATNARCQSEVQANGQFRFTALPIGDYSLHIESPSFANLIENVIHLSVGDTVRITATLSPATLQETVVVGAGADAIDLATNALGKTVTEREIVNLPLNGRNFAQLGLLQTGVWRSLRACR